jgi:hypothetical protein
MAKKKITLVANMMMRPDDFPYLSATIPALHEMCDRIVLMYNGPHFDYYEQVAEMLNENDTLIKNFQRDPDYGAMRNIMLEEVKDGEWVMRWDPDELPTGDWYPGSASGACAIAQYISRYLLDKHDAVAMQCYHLVEGNKALKIEYGHAHPRIFLKKPETRWGGKIHEQFGPIRSLHITPQVLGMAALHFSYYSPKRLRRKERHYATVPGSGHGPGTLFANIKAGLRELPPNISFQCPEGWLEMVKELT